MILYLLWSDAFSLILQVGVRSEVGFAFSNTGSDYCSGFGLIDSMDVALVKYREL